MYSVKRNAKKLKQLRMQTGKTMEETAKRLHIAKSTYSMYECAKRNPTDVNKEKIARYYKTTVGALFFGE